MLIEEVKSRRYQTLMKEKDLATQNLALKTSSIDTPLGAMVAIADENVLYLLEFLERKGLKREIERLAQKTTSGIVPGSTSPIVSIENELNQYFDGSLREFKTPIFFVGSQFQRRVWEELQKIPYGETCSYAEIAKRIGKPTAYRAVAGANGANQLAIIVPCHRVINTNGALGGYAGGLTHKKWLINHEELRSDRIPV